MSRKEIDRALYNAINDDDLQAFRQLIESHPEALRRRGCCRWTRDAIKAGRLEFVKYLIEECGVGIDELHDEEPSGSTPLATAVGHQQREITYWLLDKGAAVHEIRDGQRTCYPLVYAAASGDVELAKRLLEHGADVNSPGISGWNALSDPHCYRNVAEFLRSMGAVDSRDNSPNDRASTIIEESDVDSLYALVDHYASKFGETLEEATNSVVDWKHADEQRLEWVPFWNEVNFRCSGNEGSPSRVEWNDDGDYDHGFDGDGRLRVVTYNGGSPRFFVYGEDTIDGVDTRLGKDSVRVERYMIQDHVAKAIYSIHRDHITTYTWTFQDSSAELYCLEHSREKGWRLYGHRFRIECNQQGRIERAFSSYDFERGERLWYVKPDESDLETIISGFEDHLVEQIPECVKEAKLKHPICALVLRYPGGYLFEGHLNDMVALTPESREIAMRYDGPEYGWACGAEAGGGSDIDLELCPSGRMEEFNAKQLQYLNVVRESDDALYNMIETIRNVCRRLNQLNWSAICPVTDDFVVVPWDTTGEINWGEDIERCVSDEQFAKLEKGKWI